MNPLETNAASAIFLRPGHAAGLLLFLLYLSLLPYPAAAQWSGATMMNSYGGYISAIAARDHWVYFGEGTSFNVMDISKPSQPVMTGKTLLDYNASDIKITGNLAIVAVDNSWGGNIVYGLNIVDISNPAAPRTLSFYPLEWFAKGLSVEENIACVSTFNHMVVLDISNPAQPKLRSKITTDDSTYFGDVELVDGLAYVANTGYGLRIYDLSNPDKPVIRAGAPLNCININRLSLFGKTVYLDVDGTEFVYDVSDTSAPRCVAYADVYMEFAIYKDNLAYTIPLNYMGIQLVDVSNPQKPKVTGSVTGAFTVKIALAGNTLVSTSDLGLFLFDVSNPAHSRQLYHYPGWIGPSLYAQLALDGNYLYYGNETCLSVIDISHSPQLRLLSKIALLPGSQSLAVNGGLALCGRHSSLVVIDVSDPAHPWQRSTVDLPNNPFGIVRQSNLALLAMATSGFMIIDISDPDHPVKRGSLSTPGYAYNLVAAGNLAYVAAADGGLLIIDYSDPDHPVLRSKLDQISIVKNVAVGDGTAYLLVSGQNDPECLMTVDVRDPANPRILKNTLVNLGAWGIRLVDQTVLLAGAKAGPAAYDVRDPAQPRLIFSHPIANAPSILAVAGDWVYMLCADRNLSVVHLLSPVQVLSSNGGESVRGGETARVHWKCDPTKAGTGVRLELWDANERVATLGNAQSANGESTTTITLPLLPEVTDYRLRAVSLKDDYFYDESDAPFTVTGGPLRVHSPVGDEVWKAGEAQTIQWESNVKYSGTAVWLELWRGGRKAADLGTAWDPTGKSTTTIQVPPVEPATDYQVRAVSNWNRAWWAESALLMIQNADWVPPTRTAVEGQRWAIYQ